MSLYIGENRLYWHWPRNPIFPNLKDNHWIMLWCSVQPRVHFSYPFCCLMIHICFLEQLLWEAAHRALLTDLFHSNLPSVFSACFLPYPSGYIPDIYTDQQWVLLCYTPSLFCTHPQHAVKYPGHGLQVGGTALTRRTVLYSGRKIYLQEFKSHE